MKKFYSVTTTFDNRGRVTANITSCVEALEMPENTYTSGIRKDVYVDWFESLDDALLFVEEARTA